MKKDIIFEERWFSADIQALRDYDKGFDDAWSNGTRYELCVKLQDIFEICPRSYRRTLMYKRLAKFLDKKGITLKVISRKTPKIIQL